MRALILSVEKNVPLLTEINSYFTATVFKGYYGHQISLKEKLKYFSPERFQTLQQGLIGCGYSHVKMWETIANDTSLKDSDGVMIFEDDLILRKNETWLTAARKTQDYIDAIQQQGDLDIFFPGYLSPMYKIKVVVSGFNPDIGVPNTINGTHSYYLTKAGAVKLMDLLKIEKIKTHVDWYLASIILSKYSFFKIYALAYDKRIYFQTSCNQTYHTDVHSCNIFDKSPLLLLYPCSFIMLDDYYTLTYSLTISSHRIWGYNVSNISFIWIILGFVASRIKLVNLTRLLLIFVLVHFPEIILNRINHRNIYQKSGDFLLFLWSFMVGRIIFLG